MTRQHWAILTVIVVLLAATLLFLPWTLTFPSGKTSSAYAWAFAPPTSGYFNDWSEQKSPIRSRSLDWGRLVEEWLLILTSGSVTTVAARRRAPI